ncbi:MAG TPA: hypothetical protein VFC00_24555 [Micromonosporaceae bacterium]|nr:hypothetical protein [Micromonosporaceae bacterium]
MTCPSCGRPTMVDRPRRVVVSEWMRQELESSGEVVDLATGWLLRRDAASGQITVIDRSGEPVANVELIGLVAVSS